MNENCSSVPWKAKVPSLKMGFCSFFSLCESHYSLRGQPKYNLWFRSHTLKKVGSVGLYIYFIICFTGTGDEHANRFRSGWQTDCIINFSHYAQFELVHEVCLQSRLLFEFYNCFFICRHSFGQIIGAIKKYFKMWYVLLQAQSQSLKQFAIEQPL